MTRTVLSGERNRTGTSSDRRWQVERTLWRRASTTVPQRGTSKFVPQSSAPEWALRRILPGSDGG